jgi:hypothetical protein
VPLLSGPDDDKVARGLADLGRAVVQTAELVAEGDDAPRFDGRMRRATVASRLPDSFRQAHLVAGTRRLRE